MKRYIMGLLVVMGISLSANIACAMENDNDEDEQEEVRFESCAVCILAMKPVQAVCDAGHRLHTHCWLTCQAHNESCPTCRQLGIPPKPNKSPSFLQKGFGKIVGVNYDQIARYEEELDILRAEYKSQNSIIESLASENQLFRSENKKLKSENDELKQRLNIPSATLSDRLRNQNQFSSTTSTPIVANNWSRFNSYSYIATHGVVIALTTTIFNNALGLTSFAHSSSKLGLVFDLAGCTSLGMFWMLIMYKLPWTKLQPTCLKSVGVGITSGLSMIGLGFATTEEFEIKNMKMMLVNTFKVASSLYLVVPLAGHLFEKAWSNKFSPSK